MDAGLEASLALEAPAPIVLTTLTLPDKTVCWTDGGTVVWDGDTYAAEDADYGFLGDIEEIEDGITGSATVCAITILPPDLDALNALIEPEVQGALLTIHLGAVNRDTGALDGEPDLILRAELDAPKVTAAGNDLTLTYDCITEEARMLEPNEERRLTDRFHQSVWPSELGLSHVTGLGSQVYWRADEPNNAIQRR